MMCSWSFLKKKRLQQQRQQDEAARLHLEMKKWAEEEDHKEKEFAQRLAQEAAEYEQQQAAHQAEEAASTPTPLSTTQGDNQDDSALFGRIDSIEEDMEHTMNDFRKLSEQEEE